MKDRNLFHRVDTIGNIFTSGAATSENISDGVHEFFSVIPRGVPLPHSNILQYYVKREKCKVNDVIFTSGCEARTINLGNQNMKFGIFTGGTCVRWKNIFTDISRYPTGKNEINLFHLVNTIGNIFTRGCATRENITDGVHSVSKFRSFTEKKPKYPLFIR